MATVPFQVPLPHDTVIRLFGDTEQFSMGMVPTLLVGRTQVYGILDAVRNAILQWSLELEQQGILGEGMTFSSAEVQKAEHPTYNIQSFSGILGNVSSSQIQVGDYNSIHSELKRRGIPQEERNELEEILDDMSTATPAEKVSLAKRGVTWVTRNASALGTLSDTVRGWFEIGG